MAILKRHNLTNYRKYSTYTYQNESNWALLFSMDIKEFGKICRTCTRQDNLISLFSHHNVKHLLEICLSSQIDANDILPKQICQRCFSKLSDFCVFQDEILCHDAEFRQILNKSQLLTDFNCYENNELEYNVRHRVETHDIVQNEEYRCSDQCIQQLQVNQSIDPTFEINSIQVKDGKKKEAINQVLCDVCGKLLSSQTTLTHHLRIHSGQKPFSCNVCPKTFSKSQHLKHHIRTHTGEKPHRCQHCSKTFTQISALTAHNRTHSGEKRHICSICSKAFAQSITLTYHIRTHTGETPYECEICGKCFTHSGNLNVHRRFHNNERPFKCDLCPKSFVTISHLKVHVNQHKGVKSHSCNLCQKAFVRSTHLKEHMVTHTGEKPYTCSFCSKKYSQSGHLQRHIKKSHNQKNEYG